jgi:hypothetical protein
MDEIVQKIDSLDLDFDKTDFFEIEFCSDKCFKNAKYHKEPRMNNKEETCFCKFS